MKIFLFSSLAKDPFFFSVIFFSWARQFTPRKRTGQKSKKILTIRSISPKRGIVRKKKLLQIKRWRISTTFAESSTFSQLFNQHLKKERKTLINSNYQHNLSSIRISPMLSFKRRKDEKTKFKKKKKENQEEIAASDSSKNFHNSKITFQRVEEESHLML